MISPLPPGWEDRVESERASRGGGRRGLYKILLGLGLLAGAYVVSRWARSSDSQLSADTVRERAGDALPADESELPVIGATGESAGEEERDAADELPGEDRSPEELEERAEENIQEEPAEPGEMNVDEDVVEEVTDEPTEEDEADGSA